MIGHPIGLLLVSVGNALSYAAQGLFALATRVLGPQPLSPTASERAAEAAREHLATALTHLEEVRAHAAFEEAEALQQREYHAQSAMRAHHVADRSALTQAKAIFTRNHVLALFQEPPAPEEAPVTKSVTNSAGPEIQYRDVTPDETLAALAGAASEAGA